MKTIEERAKKASEGYADDGYSAGLYTGYKVGATEQQAIDIDKACEWIINTYLGDYIDNEGFGDNPRLADDFRKAMEKKDETH